MRQETHRHSESDFAKQYGYIAHPVLGLTDLEMDALSILGIDYFRYLLRIELNRLMAKNRKEKSKIKVLVSGMGAHWSNRQAEHFAELTSRYRDRLEEIHWLQSLLKGKAFPGCGGIGSVTLN